MSMKKSMDSKYLHNLMTLATDRNYSFFTNTILYKGLYCLFSVARVKEGIVLSSPIIGNQANTDNCTIYRTIHGDAERGLLIPIISWALEFTKQILILDMPVSMGELHGILEVILLQVWEYEGVNRSEKGLRIDLLNPVSWGPIREGNIRWDDYDSLSHAEILLKSGVIGINEGLIPHVHKENIDYFRRIGVIGEVIFDW